MRSFSSTKSGIAIFTARKSVSEIGYSVISIKISSRTGINVATSDPFNIWPMLCIPYIYILYILYIIYFISLMGNNGTYFTHII